MESMDACGTHDARPLSKPTRHEEHEEVKLIERGFFQPALAAKATSEPLTRGDVVRVRSKRNNQIAYIHRTAIPSQPETEVLQS